MSETQIVALLIFSNILGEEINKCNAEFKGTDDNKRVNENIADALCLVEFVLRHVLQREASGNPVPDGTPGTEAINSYNVSRLAHHICSGN